MVFNNEVEYLTNIHGNMRGIWLRLCMLCWLFSYFDDVHEKLNRNFHEYMKRSSHKLPYILALAYAGCLEHAEVQA